MASLVVVAGCLAPVSSHAQAREESVADMFSVLRTTAPTTLPDAARRTLARLRDEEPGRKVRPDAGQARRIGPRRAALYLVPGPDGICAIHGGSGGCSADMDAISEHGIVFWVAHPRDRKTKRRPMDFYGAVPDGLVAVSAVPSGGKKLVGTNTRRNGYRLRLPANTRWLIFTGPRGAVSVGPLKRPG